MKKVSTFIALFGAQVVFAADCPPAESIDFSGIHLGADKSSVLKVFPEAKIIKETSYITVDAEPEEFSAKIPGFWSGDFSFDKNGKINDIKFRYVEDLMQEPIEKIRKIIIKQFNLPTKGWKTKPLYDKKTLKQGRYDPNSKNSKLICKDYTIEIYQDFGAGRGALGPILYIYNNNTPRAS
jgi:hypothetical protein